MTSSTLGRLADDYLRASDELIDELDKACLQSARDGYKWSRSSAIRNSGSHGRLYPRSWRLFKLGPAHYAYGPLGGGKQSGMAFETGSRNQKRPHRNLAKSVERMGPQHQKRVQKAVDRVLGG